MEGRIKHSNLRNARKNVLHGTYTEKVCRIVERTEVGALFYGSLDVSIDEHAAENGRTAVEHSVADSLNILECVEDTVLLVKKIVGVGCPTRMGVLMSCAGVLVKTAPTRIKATEMSAMTTFEGPFPRNLRERAGTLYPLFRMLIMPEK